MSTRTRHGVIPRLADFSGGLNLRDAATELGDTDLGACFNMTIDDQGRLSSRLGRSLTATHVGGQTKNQYRSTFGIMHQAGANLYQNNTLIKTFTSTNRCGMVDFAGKLCIVHPDDGMFTWNGAAIAAVGAGPKADSIVAWQNKLWANDKNAANPPSRVNFSAAGDPTTWPGTQDVRDINDAQVVCLFSGQGQDVKGAPGLLVFKGYSAYRVNDSATGAYTTIDPANGAAGPLAAVGLLGRILVLSTAGVFQTDGVGGLEKVSGKIDPLFYGVLNSARVSDMCAGATATRAYFSMARSVSSTNDIMLEYNPLTGSFTYNSNGAGAYAYDPTQSAPTLNSGSPTDGGWYAELTGGTDLGVAITAYAQTPFVELNAGMRARLNRARVNGRGVFNIFPLYDYNLTQTISRAISVATGSASVHGGYQDIYNLGTGKSVAFYLSGTSSTTGTPPLAVPTYLTRTVGAWGLDSLDLYPAPLGRT